MLATPSRQVLSILLKCCTVTFDLVKLVFYRILRLSSRQACFKALHVLLLSFVAFGLGAASCRLRLCPKIAFRGLASSSTRSQ